MAPRRAELARAIASRFDRVADLPGTASQAMERVWDLLADHAG